MNNIIPIDKFDSVEAILDRQKGNGGGDPPMEARIAKLEAAVEYIHKDLASLNSDFKEIKKDISAIRTTDFRLTFGAIIFVAIGLAGIMAKGFGWF